MKEETPSGAGTTHTAHGIIIQEVTDIDQDNEADVFNVQDEVPKTKRRSIQCTPEHYEPCFAKEKAEPKLRVTNTTVGKTQAESQAKSSDVVWVICRALTSRQSTQVVPPWAGWVSKTETTRKSQQSTVDYMSPIFAPITENSTVQHLLKVSQEASREVHQPYTVVTFDLAVAKKAYSLVWQNPVVFSNVIV